MKFNEGKDLGCLLRVELEPGETWGEQVEKLMAQNVFYFPAATVGIFVMNKNEIYIGKVNGNSLVFPFNKGVPVTCTEPLTCTDAKWLAYELITARMAGAYK